MGHGNTNDAKIPTLIQDLFDIIDVKAGCDFSIVLDKHGRVFSFGLNNYGQLGLGNFVNRQIPTQILNLNTSLITCGYGHSLIINQPEGNVFSFGLNNVIV